MHRCAWVEFQRERHHKSLHDVIPFVPTRSPMIFAVPLIGCIGGCGLDFKGKYLVNPLHNALMVPLPFVPTPPTYDLVQSTSH